MSLHGQEVGAILAQVDGGDPLGREGLAVGDEEPLGEEAQVARLGPDGVGALALRHQMALEAMQELVHVHDVPLWWDDFWPN